MGNNISHVPSKHQLKKEKKAARKNRKSKKQEIRQDDNFISNKNNIAEENNLKSGKLHKDLKIVLNYFFEMINSYY